MPLSLACVEACQVHLALIKFLASYDSNDVSRPFISLRCGTSVVSTLRKGKHSKWGHHACEVGRSDPQP